MIKVKYIPNVLNKEGRVEREYPYSPFYTVQNYADFLRDELGADFKNTIAVIRGKVVEDTGAVVDNDKEEIIITPHVKAPVVAAFAAIGSWVASHVALTISLALTAYSVYQAVTAAKPKVPSFGSLAVDGSLDQSSPTYGWDGIQSVQDVGIPIRILYGEHRIGGNIINQYIRTDGEKQYLNLLFGLCEGEIESISEMKINDNPAENFAGVTEAKRYGTTGQSVVAGFEDQHAVYSVNANLTQNNAYTYTTVASDVEAIEATLSFPGGLFQVDSNGSIVSWEVEYKVEYKLHADPSYTVLGTYTVSDKTRASIKRVVRIPSLTPGQYDVRITRMSADSSLSPQKQGDLQLTSIDEITTEDLAYPFLALVGVEALATDQLSGGTPNFTWLVKGRKISVPNVLNAGSPVAWENYYWDPVAEVFKLLSDGTTLSWDGSTYTTAYSANPAWCLKDLLTNTRFGLGEYIDTSLIDADSFLEMAKYCDERVSDGAGGYEKRFRLDVSIDSWSSAIDVLTQLTATFRAFVFYGSGTVKLKIDKTDSPVQVFGMGNIIKSSFIQNWKSIKEIPNVVEVQFNDKNKDYQQEIAAVADETALNNGDQLRKRPIRIFCTRISQALREGKFAINVAKYVNRVVTLRAAIEAVVCQTGDLISVAHDVPQIGFSGRVQAGGSTTVVKLDQTVQLDGTKTYKITVRFADDTIETKTVIPTGGAVSQVTVSSAFSQAPAAYDVYALGESDIQTKPFRVINIKRENIHEVEITAIEYNASVYDTDGIVLPTTNYSALSLEIPLVSGLVVTERDSRLADGRIELAIDVDFIKPDYASYAVGAYKKARIYISDDAGVSWRMVGETASNRFSIVGDLVKNISYTVAVTSVASDGAETDIDNSPQSSVTVLGKQLLPSDVTSFLVNQARDQMIFGWTEVNDEDLYGYEIRRGSTWASGQVIATGIRHTNTISINAIEESAQSYWIKAIDTSGNYSQNATEAVLTIETLPFQNIIQSYAEAPDWSGTKSNMIVEEGGGVIILDPDPTASFDTVGGTFDSQGLRRFSGVPGTSGTYTTPTRDVGFRGPFKIVIDAIAIATEAAAFDDDPAATFSSDPLRRFSGYEVAGALAFEIRTSDDNVTWSAWADYQSGDYNCRYFQVRMTVTNADTNVNVVVPHLNYYADLPDVDEYGTDGEVTVAASGADITFTKTFHQTPAIVVAILSGSGIYYQLSSVDTTGFTVKLYNAAGVEQTGTFAWHAHGV